jgi:anti-sigma regulatory factor (Ser/Thr protein kinase)
MSIWWSLQLRREAASVPLARRLLVGAMDTAGVDADISHELSLALTEACANAVQHGGDVRSPYYRVTAAIDGDMCRIEVAGAGPRPPARAGGAPPAGPRPPRGGGAGAAADDDGDTLRAGVQERLRRLERRLLEDASDAPLLVVDGPLDGSVAVDHAVGYVKTHHVAYLDDTVADVVTALSAGQRTPLFLATSSWTRLSWYLRLPYGTGHPWAGIVRCETSADLPAADVVHLADQVTATLPRFASQPHKDRRAPQNLYPIGGLERQLTHRLGDAAYVLRALRSAVS